MRKSKYAAIPQVVNGIRFASQLEARRYFELTLMQKAGRIWDLELQPVFKFPMGFEYRGDFKYKEKGAIVVEDSKGMQTKEFKLKAKCFRYFYPELTLRITGSSKKVRYFIAGEAKP
jgi:hypothetical protein